MWKIVALAALLASPLHAEPVPLRQAQDEKLALLKEYLEKQIVLIDQRHEVKLHALDRYVESRLTAINLDVMKALAALNLRLEGMNEFRDTLKDQAARLAPQSEVNRMREQIALLASRDEVEIRLKILEASKNELEGKAQMSAALWGFGSSAVVGIVVAIVVWNITRSRKQMRP